MQGNLALRGTPGVTEGIASKREPFLAQAATWPSLAIAHIHNTDQCVFIPSNKVRFRAWIADGLVGRNSMQLNVEIVSSMNTRGFVSAAVSCSIRAIIACTAHANSGYGTSVGRLTEPRDRL